MVTTISTLIGLLARAAELFPRVEADLKASGQDFFDELARIVKPLIKYMDQPLRNYASGPNDCLSPREDHKEEFFPERGIIAVMDIHVDQHDCETWESGDVLFLARSGVWLYFQVKGHSDPYQSGYYWRRLEPKVWDAQQVLDVFGEHAIIKGLMECLAETIDHKRSQLAILERRHNALEAARTAL